MFILIIKVIIAAVLFSTARDLSMDFGEFSDLVVFMGGVVTVSLYNLIDKIKKEWNK